jgi:hypothetical protein
MFFYQEKQVSRGRGIFLVTTRKISVATTFSGPRRNYVFLPRKTSEPGPRNFSCDDKKNIRGDNI